MVQQLALTIAKAPTSQNNKAMAAFQFQSRVVDLLQ